ncbi:MAG: S41 family peptidase [Bacteroidales bacterium]
MKNIFILSAAILLSLLTCSTSAIAENEARLLRFPNISGDKIVFSYAGDLYITSNNGGVARKLTSHKGYEMFAKFSPDGTKIAFTGQYDGNTEVFVMPSSGGEPKRITFTATLERDDVGDRMGPNNIVMGWTPDGKNILYRTRSYTFNDFTGQLMTVPVEGGISVPVPLKNGGFAAFSPDGKKLAYNYIFREFRSWKRYTGGMADDIRIFDFKTKLSEKITDNINQNIAPMWSKDGKSVFYISDRDGYMNLYGWNSETKETEQLTHYRDYDIKFPSSGNNGIIVYEHGGYIIMFDTEEKKEERVKIYINNDAAYSRPEWKELSKSIKSFSISPNGERLLTTARGDIFSVPSNKGITYNVTSSSNANDKGADWAPDGSGFAYISDKGGEFNLYFRDNNGSEKQLTDIKGYIFGFEWSPDSKKILWSEKLNTLNLLDIESGENRVIEKSAISPINDYNWSPDSRFIVYTRPQEYVSIVTLYDTEEDKKIDITDSWYSSRSGNFSKDGKYLLFASDRSFTPIYSRTEWNHVYSSMSKIYLLPIKEGAQIPFAIKNDTVALVSPANSKEKKGKEDEVKYNFEDVESRIIELPVSASWYGNLHMIGNNVYYGSRRGSSMYNIESLKQVNLGATVIFSHGYKKAMAISGRKMQVIEIPKSPITIKDAISFEHVKKVVNYKEEWLQIYDETWRQMRDFFYAKNMHGVDWSEIYKKYRVLVPHVGHRSDLTYILGEMIGELNVGHAYSQNGEKPEPVKVKTGLLGARYRKDKSGFFEIVKILEGANWSKGLRSPLTMPESLVKEGEFIVSINGISVVNFLDVSELLVGTAESIIELEIKSSLSDKNSRKVLVEPLSDESQLIYYNWVQSNIKKVSEATNGEVGYIHIPDMGVTGLNEFVKHYYPQLGKKALIIDNRGNGGGNVSPMIIERLQRTVNMFTMHTNKREGSLNPVGTFDGPKVLLVNEYSASDGDLFPYRFRLNNLGTIVGKRTWGGVVGYSGSIPVVDGGSIVTPSYAPFAVDGSGWIIEGTGVAPDIEIENDPYKEFKGIDEQLDKAIEIVKEKIKSYQYKPATIPEFPNKSVLK